MLVGVNVVYGLVSIFALPMKSTYILFSELYVRKIYETVIDNGGVDKISKITGIDKSYFYRFFNGKRCSLKFIFSFYNALNLDLKELEKNILELVSGKNNSIGIKNPKLPFNFDTECGGVILGAIMGDGSRTKLGGLTYNNQEKKLVKNIVKSSQKVFGNVHYRISLKKDGTFQLDLPKIAGDVIGLFGIEKSYKVISDCHVDVPKFSKNMKIGFIRQFYNDEGNVRRSDRRLQVKQTRIVGEHDIHKIRENIEEYSPRILLKIKDALLRFDICSTLALETLRKCNGKNMGDFSLNIYCKENLEKFRDYIGFDIPYKQKLLIAVVNDYKFPSAPRNGKLDFALKYSRVVQEKNGFITKNLLAKESNRSVRTSVCFLIDLKKNGLVKILSTPRKKNGAPLPYKYVLVD